MIKMKEEEAIIVKNARKRYDNNMVLDGLNLTVSKGSIYGLLGASGCGKTTLLSCVVGIRRLDTGELRVLGGKPGTKGSGIPGARVGYMPQEISLVGEFTVLGALYYFGRINGLEDDEIEERHAFLKDLLQLPDKNRFVKNLSGGQQRRVSFAAALLHRPELLILDEPTVGLDPVLRDNIWQYLVNITENEGTTVVITTHYIEETKDADKIGLMRCGKLLAEASPNQLLDRFQCETLEEAFLILSKRQAEGRRSSYFPAIEDFGAQTINPQENRHAIIAKARQEQLWNSRCTKNYRSDNPFSRSNRRKFKALLTKNALQFLRHPGGILFALIFPMIQVSVFFKGIGGDPKDLTIGIVNREAGNCDNGLNLGQVIYNPVYHTCNFVDLSCRFLNEYNDSIAYKNFYTTLEEAQDAVKHGQIVGVMHFGGNFSKAFRKRQDEIKAETPQEQLESEIQVWLDMANRQIGLHIKRKMYDRFFDIYEKIVRECRLAKKLAGLPLKIEDPIFGSKNQLYSDFMAPAFLLTLLFFLATSVSSTIIITDRHEGVWDRSLVQGVSTTQILMAHFLTQLTIIVIQCTVTLTMSFLQFDLHCKGSIFLVIALMFLMGVCGMCYGFLISVFCSSHTMANYITTGSFYPVILLCGCIWPIEGIPKCLMWVSLSMPTTVPAIAVRSVLDKGYSFMEADVYNGFLTVSGWTASFIILCIVGLKTKSA
ncbi:ABC transporter G family member 20-like [Prorops nasuta]|uniref:ABC transporter G family member 20-like n=1 Tax=Prorops nasuta TaxID=863751 RepID=UPI0034CE51C7